MNPDGTFVDEDGETEDYHVTDVSENDRKRLHYLKKQQRKKDHGKKHRPRHRGPAPAPGERRERREPRDPRVLKHHERSGRGMATKHRDAPGKVNRFQEHLHAREEDQERQRRERRKKRAEAKAQKARALRQTVVEDDDMGDVQDISGWDHKDEQEARGREMARLDTRCRAREFVLTLPGGGCCGLYGQVRADVRVDPGLPALALHLLDLTDRDLSRHWVLFDEAAGDDNEISHDEFFDLIDVDPTTFLKCLVDAIVFDWADLDKDRTLSFSEFLLASCVMCTLTQRQLAFFVFAYFDENDDGHLDYHELQQISHAMEGSRFGGDMAKFLDVCNMIQIEHHTHKVVEARKMGFGGFQEACNRCPLVVHPIMRLQEAMQMRTLGADRWKRLRDDYGGDFHHEMTEAGLLMLGEKKELAYEKNDSSLSFRETAA